MSGSTAIKERNTANSNNSIVAGNNISLPPIRNIENYIGKISREENIHVPADRKELGYALSDLGNQVKKILSSSLYAKTEDALSKLKPEDQYVALFYIKSRFENAKSQVSEFTSMLSALAE